MKQCRGLLLRSTITLSGLGRKTTRTHRLRRRVVREPAAAVNDEAFSGSEHHGVEDIELFVVSKKLRVLCRTAVKRSGLWRGRGRSGGCFTVMEVVKKTRPGDARLGCTRRALSPVEEMAALRRHPRQSEALPTQPRGRGLAWTQTSDSRL